MKKTAKYFRRYSCLMILTTIGLVWLLAGVSCEKTELTRSIDWDENTEIIEDSVKVNDKSGFSFELESDTLKEEIEEIHFHAKEWEDVGMDADL